MRKAGLFFAVAGFFAMALSSCGETYTPMTEEQISAKVDSMFNAQSEAITKEKQDACTQSMEASVAAKVEELKTAATAATETK